MAAPVIATLGYVASRNTEVVDTVKEIYNIAFSEEKAKFLDGEEGEEEEDEQDFFSYEDEVIGGEDLYIEEEADITPEQQQALEDKLKEWNWATEGELQI